MVVVIYEIRKNKKMAEIDAKEALVLDEVLNPEEMISDDNSTTKPSIVSSDNKKAVFQEKENEENKEEEKDKNHRGRYPYHQ